MKRIVRGNDFTMRIPVVKIVDGEKVAFPLPGCTDIVVRLCSAYRRLELAYTIDAKEDNVIVARVEGDRIPLGTYALEVRGKVFGNDWRSNEYEQLIIVDNNEKADTEFGKTDEGENSVEMDTAIVYLPPSAELSGLITEAQETVKTVTALNEQVTVSEEERAKSEESRVQAEQAREANELTRKNNEAKRQDNETARQIAEGKRETDTTSAISAMKTKTDSAIASMDEHRTAFDNAEAARVGNEEARQANEQARITAETKRESDMAQAVEKANTASDIAISANEPFVWMPFADLEHWNITAMDLATGTVTLDTEEHGLAVGDLVTLAANIEDWVHLYNFGKPWEGCMASSRMAGYFPVRQRGAIPAVKVTAVNGAEIQCDGLKVSTNIVPAPSDWQLQRCATAGRSVALPARFKGKPVTVTVEGQYVSYSTAWSFYHARTVLHDDKGNAIFSQLGDPVCGLPFVKQMCSMRSGHIELADIGMNVYGEKATVGNYTSLFYSSNKTGAWDIGQATNLYMEKVLGHYATRVIVTPYQELTKLGGVNSEDSERKRQLAELIEKQKLQFGVGLVDSNEYTVPETDIQTTNFNIVDTKTITTLLAEMQCAFTPQDDLYVVIGGQNKFVFGQKGGRLVITSKDAFEGANEYTDLEDMGAAADGEYHRYRLYVDGGDEGKVTLDVDGVRVKEMDYVTGKVICNNGSAYGCIGFLGQSIRWSMSYRPPMGVKLKGLQTIVTADANKSKLVSFAPCAGTNWLAYFDTAWYPQMNGANYCSFKKWPSLANGYNVQSTTHVPWLGAVLTHGDRAWVGCADGKWAGVAP